MTKAQIDRLLSNPSEIVITTHNKPDGDAMGSSLGLYHYLVGKGHSVKVISPTDYPFFLHWMPSNDEVIIYTDHIETSKNLINNAKIIFCLDFNTLNRINELGELVRNSAATKVLIDHHLEPEDFDDFRLWDTDASSTAELIYRFIGEAGDHKLVDSTIATCLYTGIMTDTGSFRFPRTTSALHRVVADLIDCGADNSGIHSKVYDNFSEKRLRFLGFCLKDKLTILHEFNTAYLSLNKKELAEYGVGTGDTEGIVNYALSINEIQLAIVIIERGDLVKLSFRSKGNFPANQIAKKYFNGGGHFNAAGGQTTENLETTTQKVISILPEFKQLLNNNQINNNQN